MLAVFTFRLWQGTDILVTQRDASSSLSLVAAATGILPGKSHGRRSLVGRGPWGGKESDMTERLHFHFSLSCIGEGNGNLLQCSCLEKPRDSGACWAAVCGVAQSRTGLKSCSSSSSHWDHHIHLLILIPCPTNNLIAR